MLKLVTDLKFLEGQIFHVIVEGKICKEEFKLGELPNDMKMIGFLGGELSNAAYYFSTFDVNQEDANDFKNRLGSKNEWKVFDYEKRIIGAKNVQIKHEELNCKILSETSKRSHLTELKKSKRDRVIDR